MGNPEKLITYGIQNEEIHNKNTTQHVLDTTTRKQTQTTQIKHVPSDKQLEVIANLLSFLCGNGN